MHANKKELLELVEILFKSRIRWFSLRNETISNSWAFIQYTTPADPSKELPNRPNMVTRLSFVKHNFWDFGGKER